MQKLFAVLLSVLVLGLGAGFAQTNADVSGEGVTIEIAPEAGVEFDTTQFVGLSAPNPFSAHYGLEDVDLFGTNPDLRFRFSGNPFAQDLKFGVDVMFDIAQLEDKIQLYGGPALELGTLLPLQPSFGLVGFIGAEYRFNREFGFFAEIGTSVNIPIKVVPRFALGANYHF